MILPLDSELGPVIFAKEFTAIGKDLIWQKNEVERCKAEPWYWAVNYIWTIKKDENVRKPEVMRFPAFANLRFVFNECFIEPMLAIDKSRQLKMTWLMMLYCLFWAQFQGGETIICQTKKEEVADTELIWRAEFMRKSQPVWLRRPGKKSYKKLVFPKIGAMEESKILGIPSGGDQIRSMNPSRVLIDEGGFFDAGEFEECRTAALACCQDIKCVSTANGGDWDDFINDKIMEAA